MKFLSQSPQYKAAAENELMLMAYPGAMNFSSAEPSFLHPCYFSPELAPANMQGFGALNMVPQDLREGMRVFLARKIGADVPRENFCFSLSTFRIFRAVLNCLPQIYDEDVGLSDDSTVLLCPQGAYYLFNRIAGSVLRWDDCISTIPTGYEKGYKLCAQDIEDWVKANGPAYEGRPLLLLLENPTVLGHMYSAEELQEIDYVCARHRIFIFTDEVYRETYHPDETFVSLASQTSDLERIISVFALSKSYGNLQYSLSLARMAHPLRELAMGYIGDDWRSTTLHHNFITRSIVEDGDTGYLENARQTYAGKAAFVAGQVEALNERLQYPVRIVYEPRAGYSTTLDITQQVEGGAEEIDPDPNFQKHKELFTRFAENGLVIPSLHAAGIDNRLCFRFVYGKNPEEDIERAFRILGDVIA